MNPWEQLTAVALLGTERQSTPPNLPEDALAPLLNQLDVADLEGWLLSSAGLLAAYHQAGQRPSAMGQSLPAASPPNPLPEIPDCLLPYLPQVLGGKFERVLPEYLDLLRQKGYCLSPQYLPQLLDWGCYHSTQHPLIRAVIGPRGNWLARQNPQWAYAVVTPQPTDPAEYTTLWETGDRPIRLRLLSEWRQSDPNRAREQVAATWKQESAKDRAAFLTYFAENLSTADEPFLEMALRDRSKEIRRIAAVLLSSLPEFQFSQDIGHLIEPYIQFSYSAKQKLTVEVTLPNLDDAQWQTYSFLREAESLPRPSKQGDRAQFLTELLGVTPLSSWAAVGSPGVLLKAIARTDWELLFVQGWSLATQRQENPEWAKALLGWFQQKSTFRIERMGAVATVKQLLSLLPSEARWPWILGQMDNQSWNNSVMYQLLQTLPTPWPLDCSRTLFASAQQYLENTQTQGEKKMEQVRWSIAYQLQSMADLLHPDVLETCEALALSDYYQGEDIGPFDECWQMVQFRRNLHQAANTTVS